MDDFGLIIDMMVLFYAIRILIVWGKMLTSGKLPDSRLIRPADADLTACSDPAACRHYLLPRLMVFGFTFLFCGGGCLVMDIFPSLYQKAVASIFIVIFLIGVVLYGITMRKVARVYY